MNDSLFVAVEFRGTDVVSTMSTPDRDDLKPNKGNKMEVLTYSEELTITG